MPKAIANVSAARQGCDGDTVLANPNCHRTMVATVEANRVIENVFIREPRAEKQLRHLRHEMHFVNKGNGLTPSDCALKHNFASGLRPCCSDEWLSGFVQLF
jgi:hypothetical protein